MRNNIEILTPVASKEGSHCASAAKLSQFSTGVILLRMGGRARLNAVASKPTNPDNGFEGSNPSPSANFRRDDRAWLKVAVLKTDVRHKRTVGSNPTLSANFASVTQLVECLPSKQLVARSSRARCSNLQNPYPGSSPVERQPHKLKEVGSIPKPEGVLQIELPSAQSSSFPNSRDHKNRHCAGDTPKTRRRGITAHLGHAASVGCPVSSALKSNTRSGSWGSRGCKQGAQSISPSASWRRQSENSGTGASAHTLAALVIAGPAMRCGGQLDFSGATSRAISPDKTRMAATVAEGTARKLVHVKASLATQRDNSQQNPAMGKDEWTIFGNS